MLGRQTRGARREGGARRKRRRALRDSEEVAAAAFSRGVAQAPAVLRSSRLGVGVRRKTHYKMICKLLNSCAAGPQSWCVWT